MSSDDQPKILITLTPEMIAEAMRQLEAPPEQMRSRTGLWAPIPMPRKTSTGETLH
jgi:hypothetical protein